MLPSLLGEVKAYDSWKMSPEGKKHLQGALAEVTLQLLVALNQNTEVILYIKRNYTENTKTTGANCIKHEPFLCYPSVLVLVQLRYQV